MPSDSRTQSVQRYQLAVDEAKVRLNLAGCPGAWLMPARMIINTENTIGYNNKLMQAKAGMKLGINNDVNSGTKKAGLQLMDGGASKINPPNSRPFKPNPQSRNGRTITEARFEKKNEKIPVKPPDEETVSEKPLDEEKTPQHEINKTAAIVGGVGVVALLFMALR